MMPIYAYKCDNCEATRQLYCTIKTRNRAVGKTCVVCRKGKMARNINGEHVHSTEQDYYKPVLSDAMGVHPSQVQEHRRMHPDIPMLDDGRVECRSHADRKRIMKKLGFFDKDGY